MNIAKYTKAELVAHIAGLDAQLVAHGCIVRDLRDALAMARSAPALPLGKAAHTSYYDYVRECKVAQRGQRVCTYKSYSQWSAA